MLSYSESEAPVLDVANVLYAFPMHSTDQQNVQEPSLKLTPTDMQGEDGKYMELADSTIVLSECPTLEKTVK